MEIKVDFSHLWKQVRRVSSDKVEVDWTAAEQLDPIDIELLAGRDVRLEDLQVVNGLLSVEGRQVLLYIPDQYSPVDVVKESPEKGKRFHVADCKTLVEMRSKGRFERYVATIDDSGIFEINGKNSAGQRASLESGLLVCKNCLEHLNYKNYCHDSGKFNVWKRFNIREFFETYSTSFRYLPRRVARAGDVDEYTKDWSDISARLRRQSGFMCSSCRVNLSESKHLLHVHHINGVKQDNNGSNLQPLCADCHRKQPFHDHMFISMADMQLLTRLRRDQGISADGWEQVMKLADLSVHGALLRARHRGFDVPEIGYQLLDSKVEGATAEAAWPESRIAIVVSSPPELPGWTILSPANFINYY